MAITLPKAHQAARVGGNRGPELQRKWRSQYYTSKSQTVSVQVAKYSDTQKKNHWSLKKRLTFRKILFIFWEKIFLFHCKKIVLIVCHVTVTSVMWLSRDLVLVLWFGCVHYEYANKQFNNDRCSSYCWEWMFQILLQLIWI